MLHPSHCRILPIPTEKAQLEKITERRVGEKTWKKMKMKIHYIMETALDVIKMRGWYQLAILLLFLEIGSTQQRKFEMFFHSTFRNMKTLAMHCHFK